MPNIILPTKETQDAINTRTTTMNTNLNTVNTNLGAPTTAASNSTSSNVHSKLNWLTSNITTSNNAIGELSYLGDDLGGSSSVHSSMLPKIQVYRYGKGPYQQVPELAYTLLGSGVIKYTILDGYNQPASRLKVVIDDRFELVLGGAHSAALEVDIPFKTSIKIWKESVNSAGKVVMLYVID